MYICTSSMPYLCTYMLCLHAYHLAYIQLTACKDICMQQFAMHTHATIQVINAYNNAFTTNASDFDIYANLKKKIP